MISEPLNRILTNMQIDPACRSFKWKSIVGACVKPGSPSLNSYSGLGDCLLLNFQTGFFAVSDSSDRNPCVSRRLLIQFDQMLVRTAFNSSQRLLSIGRLNSMKDEFAVESENILESAIGSSSCTITGIYLVDTDVGRAGVIFHTGDSGLYKFDFLSSRFHELTERNFWMVGRSRKLFQISVIEFGSPTSLIMATDGLPIFLAVRKSKMCSELTTIIKNEDISDIPEKFVDKLRPVNGFEDDAAAIAISMQKICRVNKRIIMGGTNSHNITE